MRAIGVTFGLILCSCSATPSWTSNATAASPASLVLNSADLYQGYQKVAGSGWLSANYERIGAMPFDDYFDYLRSVTPNAQLVIDTKRLGNPATSLRDRERALRGLAPFFPNVQSFWSTTGLKPQVFTSGADYAAALRGQSPNAVALLKDDFSPCTMLLTAVGYQLWQWVRGQSGDSTAVPTQQTATRTDRNRYLEAHDRLVQHFSTFTDGQLMGYMSDLREQPNIPPNRRLVQAATQVYNIRATQAREVRNQRVRDWLDTLADATIQSVAGEPSEAGSSSGPDTCPANASADASPSD